MSSKKHRHDWKRIVDSMYHKVFWCRICGMLKINYGTTKFEYMKPKDIKL